MKAPVKRRYNSQRRGRQADATREGILGAARELFSTRGYGAVLVDDIAAAAGVAPPTVYAAGGKRVLLQDLLTDVVTAGRGGAPVGADPDGPRLQDLDGVDAVIDLHVRNVCAFKERGATVHSVLWRAAASSPEVADIWERFKETALEGHRELARRLHQLGALRDDLDVESAARIAFTLSRPEAYDALVVEARWDLDRWSAFLRHAVRRLLLR